jgi:hypothetical protein
MAEVLGVVAAAMQLGELALKTCQALQAFRGYRGKMRDYEKQINELTIISKTIQTNPLLHTDEIQTAVHAILVILAENPVQLLLVRKHPVRQAINCIFLPKAWENLSESIAERKSTLSLCILQVQSSALHQILASQGSMENNPASSTLSHADEGNESAATSTGGSDCPSGSAGSYAESNTTVSDNEGVDFSKENEKNKTMPTRSASFTRNYHRGEYGTRGVNPPSITARGSRRGERGQRAPDGLFQGQIKQGTGEMFVGAHIVTEGGRAPLRELMRGLEWSNNQQGTEDQMGPTAPEGTMTVGVEFAPHITPEPIAGTWRNNIMYHNGDMFVGVRF